MNIKTAAEMYQFCVDNNFGEGMNRKWGEKHFSLIESNLQSDEEVLMCFIGLHNYVSMTNHNDNFAYAITNKRFIMAQKKLVGEIIQSVSIQNLNDITVNIGLLFGTVTFDTLKETFNIGVNKIAARSIQEKAHEILLSYKNNAQSTPASAPVVASAPAPVSGTSIADELIKYKQLLDMGAISQEEFDTLKAKLLF